MRAISPSSANGISANPRCRWHDERGIGLFEVIAGTLIATIAVLGLAYSFGVARGQLDRYLIARTAMGRAQLILDSLATTPPAALRDSSYAFTFEGAPCGRSVWRITWLDDPIDGTQSSDPNPHDLKHINVIVRWTAGGVEDSITLSRSVLGR